MVKTTDINNDSDEEDRTVAGTERKAKMALAGPKMEIWLGIKLISSNIFTV